MIGRFFYGPGLCRDENFLRVTFEGEVDFYEVAYAIAKWPILMRPLATRLLPRARALRDNYQAMARLLTPVLEERLRTWPIGVEKSTGRPNDFMQWMLDASQSQLCSLERQCQILLDMTSDAAFATNVQLTQISFDLATHPEYIETLRDEFEEVLARPQEMTRSSLGRMAKLDSVLKETHRTSPQAFGNSIYPQLQLENAPFLAWTVVANAGSSLTGAGCNSANRPLKRRGASKRLAHRLPDTATRTGRRVVARARAV